MLKDWWEGDWENVTRKAKFWAKTGSFTKSKRMMVKQ